jgi:hypothetical protein
MVKVGLLARLEAKPGKEAEVGSFIGSGRRRSASSTSSPTTPAGERISTVRSRKR